MIMFIEEFVRKMKSGNEIPDALRETVSREIRSDERDGEYQSWKNSYRELAIVLEQVKDALNLQIMLEYNLKCTPFRCDAILMGKKNGVDKLLIIELKQWEQGYVEPADLENVIAYEERKEHPLLQALGYQRIFENGYSAVSEHNIKVESCVFLHNYVFLEDKSQDALVNRYTNVLYDENRQDRMFGREDYEAFVSFIKNEFDSGSDTVADAIIDSDVKLDSFISGIRMILEGRPVFTPTEDQNRVIGNIINHLNTDPDRHSVFVVKGGPGTGKTVLAFHLLTKLGANTENDGMGYQQVKYVSKNSQLVNTYLGILRSGPNYNARLTVYNNRTLNMLFSQVNAIIDDEIEYDCLIIDESQRLQQTYMENNEWRSDILKKLVDKSKNTVFLLDDDQKLAFNDVSFSSQMIEIENMQNVSVFPERNNNDLISFLYNSKCRRK